MLAEIVFATAISALFLLLAAEAFDIDFGQMMENKKEQLGQQWGDDVEFIYNYTVVVGGSILSSTLLVGTTIAPYLY